jgi:uncharacterized protein
MNNDRLLQGPVGNISLAIDLPDSQAHSLAIVCHPHPLFGGTRDNKVVQSIAKAFLAMGYEVWRPNFRGVGQSEGNFDHGQGELLDMQLVYEQALADFHNKYQQAPAELVLAGFSFGSAVIANLASQVHSTVPTRLVLVGTAVARFSVPAVPESSLIIHGDQDTTVALSDVLAWATQHNLVVQVVAGADHFFHRRLTLLKRTIWRSWGANALVEQSQQMHDGAGG